MVWYNNRDLDKAVEYATNIQDGNYSKSDLKNALLETGFDLQVCERAISKLEVEKNRQIRQTSSNAIRLSTETSEYSTSKLTTDLKEGSASRLSIILQFIHSTIRELLHNFKPLFYLFAVLYLLSIFPMQASFHEFANTKIIVSGEEFKLFNVLTFALKLVAFSNFYLIPIFLSLYAFTSSKKYLSRMTRSFTRIFIVKYLTLISYIIFR